MLTGRNPRSSAWPPRPHDPAPTPPPSGPSGTLDPSFDGDGIVVTNFDGGNTEASAVQQQPDGKVVAVGTMFAVGIDFKTVVARYNSNGSLDPSFGSAGTAVLNLISSSSANPSGYEIYSAIALQKDGKILVGGGTSGLTPLMARLTPTGALDPTFGNGGVVIVPELTVGG
ncbi:delta-60 repeat domain-containing protein [Deinococcus malanensis]|uniref:delta-60 repeat domain-containing protein n=1 Tax=Deinococcus malanensis TaxID=1706855 RepID=UPI003640ECFC